MTKTQNYNLNKPEAGDPLRLADFNQNSDLIDTALASLSADHVYVGNYVGDGTSDRIIELPFEPKFAVLFGQIHSEKRIVFLLPDMDFCTGSYGWESVPAYNTQISGNAFVIQNSSFNNQTGVTFSYVLFR